MLFNIYPGRIGYENEGSAQLGGFRCCTFDTGMCERRLWVRGHVFAEIPNRLLNPCRIRRAMLGTSSKAGRTSR